MVVYTNSETGFGSGSSASGQKITALIVAAGKGTRMGTSESKQYLQLNDKPLLVHTLLTFEQAPLIDEIVLVCGAEDIDRCQSYKQTYNLQKLCQIIPGGAERQLSVYEGLKALDHETGYVLIHDGVRPFVSNRMLQSLVHGLLVERHPALVAAVRVKDTIKLAEEIEDTDLDSESSTLPQIKETLPRQRLWAIQTPQAFRMQTILDAHNQAVEDGFIGTDDAVLIERLGQTVHIVQGDPFNIKITTPEDMLLAQAIIQWREERDE